MRTTIKGIIVLICVTIFETAPALACGSDFVMTMMFRAYPEAKLVYDAEQRAQETGLFIEQSFAKRSNEFLINHHPQGPKQEARALHRWRVKKIAVTMSRLKKRLQSVPALSLLNKKLHIFLIHELQWVELRATETGFKLALKDTLPSDKAPRIFTTRQILDSFLEGTLSWPLATKKQLIVARGTNESVRQWFFVLRKNLSRRL